MFWLPLPPRRASPTGLDPAARAPPPPRLSAARRRAPPPGLERRQRAAGLGAHGRRVWSACRQRRRHPKRVDRRPRRCPPNGLSAASRTPAPPTGLAAASGAAPQRVWRHQPRAEGFAPPPPGRGLGAGGAVWSLPPRGRRPQGLEPASRRRRFGAPAERVWSVAARGARDSGRLRRLLRFR